MNKIVLIQRLSTLAGAGLVLLTLALWLAPVLIKNPAGLPTVSAKPEVSSLDIPPVFGQQDQAAVEQAQPTPPPNIQLAGVIAGGHKPMALLIVDGKMDSFQLGDTVSPGVSLVGVGSEQVTFKVNGSTVTIDMPEKALTPGAQAQVAPGPGPAVVQHAPAPAAKLAVQSLGPNHLSLSKSELNRLLQDPVQARNLGRAEVAPAGGLLISDVPPGSIPDRLGIRTADILKSVNGQAITSLNDLQRLYKEFGSAATVNLDVYRNGQATLLQYTLKP